MKYFYFFAGLMSFCSTAITQSLPTLTALYEKNKNVVKLRWQHTDAGITSYSIQRSSDNSNYKDICIKDLTDNVTGDFIKFTDDKIASGKNYYRLKINRKNSSSLITSPVMVIQGNTESKWLLYPVPVGPVLNLQYAGSDALQGVITVVIQSVSSGTIFTKLRLASTTRTIPIPVTNIGKGIYDIRIYIGNDVAWNQRFVK